MSLPAQVFSGERFPIDVALSAPRAGEATVEISAEGKPLGTSRVELAAGLNHFRVHANLTRWEPSNWRDASARRGSGKRISRTP